MTLPLWRRLSAAASVALPLCDCCCTAASVPLPVPLPVCRCLCGAASVPLLQPLCRFLASVPLPLPLTRRLHARMYVTSLHRKPRLVLSAWSFKEIKHACPLQLAGPRESRALYLPWRQVRLRRSTERWSYQGPAVPSVHAPLLSAGYEASPPVRPVPLRPLPEAAGRLLVSFISIQGEGTAYGRDGMPTFCVFMGRRRI